MAPLQNVALVDFIHCLSRTMDLVSKAVVDHHVRVGYFAFRLATDAGFSCGVCRDLLVAGLLHDAGALSLTSRLDALQFEHDGTVHAEAGYRLLRPYPRLRRPAEYVRLHHTSYLDMREMSEVLPGAGILQLADRVDALIDRGGPLHMQIQSIRERIRLQAGRLLDPEHVDLFLSYAPEHTFWTEAERPQERLRSMASSQLPPEMLEPPEVLELSLLFSQIIDFRSRFTSTHSSGVAECATVLARMIGFDDQRLRLMRVAGNLHDLGKLAVPREILDKPGLLDEREWQIMRDHAMYTEQVLADLPGMERIARWAGDHHERLDGRGYPSGLGSDELSLGSRIVAVADVFTALSEDRPYRAGMQQSDVLNVMRDMAGTALDGDVVALLDRNHEEINGLRRAAQQRAARLFSGFDSEVL